MNTLAMMMMMTQKHLIQLLLYSQISTGQIGEKSIVVPHVQVSNSAILAPSRNAENKETYLLFDYSLDS